MNNYLINKIIFVRSKIWNTIVMIQVFAIILFCVLFAACDPKSNKCSNGCIGGMIILLSIIYVTKPFVPIHQWLGRKKVYLIDA